MRKPEGAMSSLKKSAQRSTSLRNHRMSWQPITIHEGWTPHCGRTAARASQIGSCRDCGRVVVLTNYPAPNDIAIGGDALAVNCERR